MNCHPDRSAAEWRDLLFTTSVTKLGAPSLALPAKGGIRESLCVLCVLCGEINSVITTILSSRPKQRDLRFTTILSSRPKRSEAEGPTIPCRHTNSRDKAICPKKFR